MRPVAFFRLILVSLFVLLCLYLLFSALMPSERTTVAPPAVSAAVAGDRIYASYAYRSPVNASRMYAITAIPVVEAERIASEDKPAKPPTPLTTVSPDDSDGEAIATTNGDAAQPWLPVERNSGTLLGLIGKGEHLAVVFDTVVRLHAISEPLDPKLTLPAGPSQVRPILSDLSTMELPREFMRRFRGSVPGDLLIGPFADPADSTASSGSNEPGLPDTLDLVIFNPDRFARIRIHASTRTAEPIGLPAFLSVNELGEVALSADAPAETTPAAPAAEVADATDAAQTQPASPDDDTDSRPEVGVAGIRWIPSATNPDTDADVFFTVGVMLTRETGFGTRRLAPEFRFYWQRLRDGQWQPLVLLGTHIQRFDVVPGETLGIVHLIYDYAHPDERGPKLKYRRLDVNSPRTDPERPASDVRFQMDGPQPRPTSINALLANNRLHLFFLREDGQPMHAMATLPFDEAATVAETVTLFAPKPISVFQPRVSRNSEPIWMLIVIAFFVISFSMLMLFLRQRRQSDLGDHDGHLPILTDTTKADGKKPDDETAPDEGKEGKGDAADTAAEPPSDASEETDRREKSSRRGLEADKPDLQPMDFLDPDAMIERFGYYPGGPLIRFLALSVDFLVLLVPLYLGADALGIVIDDLAAPFAAPDFLRAYLYMWGLHVVYFTLMEYYLGRSLGKMLLGLRVRTVERAERPLEPKQIIIRNLFRGVDYILFPLMLFSDRFQRIGDRFAETVVARDTTPAEPTDEM